MFSRIFAEKTYQMSTTNASKALRKGTIIKKDVQGMFHKTKPCLSFKKLSVLITGVIIGMFSQHFLELKYFPNQIFVSSMIPFFSRTMIQETQNFAHPISSFIIHRPGYSFAYDGRNRNPAWVYEHVINESINGNADRTHSDFKEDEEIPEILRATSADYKGQGFDRGHMAPAANHRGSQEAMSDTFYMTNMCPQCPQFNRGYWSKLEKHVRDLTKDYQNVYSITGPLYLPTFEADGKLYVKYQVIGENNVAVPTHFFKIIILEDKFGVGEKRAYILPNAFIPAKTPIVAFLTSIENVEKAAGFVLCTH